MTEILQDYESVHGYATSLFEDLLSAQPECSRAELFSQVAQGVLDRYFLSFHANAQYAGTPEDKRWDIYAEGGYLLGVETNIPHQETQTAVLESLDLQPGSRLLVCGSGPGPLEQQIVDRNLPVEKITALDGSEAMVRLHQQRFSNRAEITVRLANLNDASWTDGLLADYDRVAIVNTLEFLDISAFLGHLDEVLSVGAQGVIVTPKHGMKNYLPAMRAHLEACAVNLENDFWQNLDARLTQLLTFLYPTNNQGLKVLDVHQLEDERVNAYLQQFTTVLGYLADTVSTDETKTMTSEAQAVFTMGLANALTPAVVQFPTDEALFEQLKAAGFAVAPVTDWETVNAGLSRKITISKD